MTIKAIMKGVRDGSLTPQEANKLLPRRYVVKLSAGTWYMFPIGENSGIS